MDANLREGIEKEMQIIVKEKDTASSYGSGLLNVYATPAMITLMENTAHASISDLLSKELASVGIEINVKHLKATPIGRKLICRSKLAGIDGKRLRFEIQVRDKDEVVGEAVHIRYIVDIKKFMERIS